MLRVGKLQPGAENLVTVWDTASASARWTAVLGSIAPEALSSMQKLFGADKVGDQMAAAQTKRH